MHLDFVLVAMIICLLGEVPKGTSPDVTPDLTSVYASQCRAKSDFQHQHVGDILKLYHSQEQFLFPAIKCNKNRLNIIKIMSLLYAYFNHSLLKNDKQCIFKVLKIQKRGRCLRKLVPATGST